MDSCNMDELKLRLAYLEQVSQQTEQKQTLLNQVDALGEGLNEMLDKQAAAQLQRRAATAPPPSADSAEVPLDVQRQAIVARGDALSRLVSSLGATNLRIPPPPPEPPIEAAQRLMEQATELGREFDELTVRSTELTTRLLKQVTQENQAVGSSN